MRLPVECEALIVGMAIVPGLLSRNRSFDLFENPDVRRARRRAALVSGIVRQLAGVQGQVASVRVTRAADGACELSYTLPGMKMHRRASLSDVEVACVRYLAARLGVTELTPSDEDRGTIDGALRRLAAGLRLADVERGLNL
jgi:hypothetical protein